MKCDLGSLACVGATDSRFELDVDMNCDVCHCVPDESKLQIK